MIITVTMNPAIDKTINIDKFVYAALNRIKYPVVDAGGKGINVSKTIKAIGGESIATGFLGKTNSDNILDYLNKNRIKNDFVVIDGITRTNTKIVEKDGTLTELNEQGMTVSQEKIEELESKLISYANKETIFILAGSIPKGVDNNIYSKFTKKLKEYGARVIVDADGELLSNSLKENPSIIKPNQIELANYYGVDENIKEKELINLAQDLVNKGIEMVAVSRGSKGAVFVDKKEIIICRAHSIIQKSSVGAGDAMVAAIAFGLETNMNFISTVKLAMAVSAGAVTTLGTKPSTMDTVEGLLNEDIIESIRRNNYEDKSSSNVWKI